MMSAARMMILASMARVIMDFESRKLDEIGLFGRPLPETLAALNRMSEDVSVMDVPAQRMICAALGRRPVC